MVKESELLDFAMMLLGRAERKYVGGRKDLSFDEERWASDLRNLELTYMGVRAAYDRTRIMPEDKR